jgi:inward rectifier potassium channel
MKKRSSVFSSKRNTGFGSLPENEGSRLINKSGSVNIIRTGLKFSERFDVFHWLINMNWLTFFSFLLIGYVVVNSIFAIIYVSLGIDGLSGVHSFGFFNQFLDAFYFSTQTITTLGYGAISPISTAHNLVASFESYLGLLSFATSTGLLYGRFSKPKSKIKFSHNALISPFKEGLNGLMMRLVNSKNDQLINTNASVTFSYLDTSEGNSLRKFQKLDLEISHIEMLASTWTIVHPITENSILYNQSEKQLKKLDLEILLIVDAFDETYSQQIHSRTSYKFNELVVGAKFVRILNQNGNKQSTLSLDKFNDFDKVSLN